MTTPDLSAMEQWVEVAALLRELPAGAIVTIARGQIPGPHLAFARPSMGLPMGQWADWRWRLADGGSLHVREYSHRFEAHLDRVDPAEDLLGHLALDAPWVGVLAGAVAGALVGRAVAGDRGALYGGIGGGAAGLALMFALQRQALPRPSGETIELKPGEEPASDAGE